MKNIKTTKTMRSLFKYCVVSLALLSCDSDQYLQKVPPTEIGSGEVFSSPQRIEGLVNGIYASAKSANFYGGRLLMFLDVRGEDFVNVTSNAFTGYESWLNAYSSGSNDIVNVWSAGYTTINRANILIAGLAENPDVIEQSLANQYIAEAKFMRALSYFTMVTVFAQPYTKDQGASPGLPLRLQAETTSDNNDLARSSVADVYTQILNDLNEAEAGLPDSYSSALLNTTRAHKNTVIALKTRVLLTKGDYPGVVTEAQKLVPQNTAPFSATSGVQHALQPSLVEIIENNYTTSESILSMPFTELNMLGGQSALGYIYSGIGDYFLAPQGILGEAQWATNDERRDFLRVNVANDRHFLIKWGHSSPYLRYMPVMRYAEVLLNYAEALAETGNTALGFELLKAVHGRSDASYTFPASLATDKDALIQAILIERRIEFIGEGHRSNDLLRRGLTIPGKSGGGFTAEAIPPSSPNYIWPISNAELVTNGLMTSN